MRSLHLTPWAVMAAPRAVMAAPRAMLGPVMPGVQRTPGRLCGGDAPGGPDLPPCAGYRIRYINTKRNHFLVFLCFPASLCFANASPVCTAIHDHHLAWLSPSVWNRSCTHDYMSNHEYSRSHLLISFLEYEYYASHLLMSMSTMKSMYSYSLLMSIPLFMKRAELGNV